MPRQALFHFLHGDAKGNVSFYQWNLFLARVLSCDAWISSPKVGAC